MISILFLFISLLSSNSVLQRARQELLMLKKSFGRSEQALLVVRYEDTYSGEGGNERGFPSWDRGLARRNTHEDHPKSL